ncbi:hypothetical protein [Bacillus cereus]|uniref:Uncharacterized protein n=1 Tax=Bacillus cereus (strain VD146) TaxID=1053236 RepID=R8MDU6_BACCX|nr:hypothetical protein [Bacillus cereus]EOP32306.1 hypothetical protein IK1_05842 [Bacillus cereus VD146]
MNGYHIAVLAYGILIVFFLLDSLTGISKNKLFNKVIYSGLGIIFLTGIGLITFVSIF